MRDSNFIFSAVLRCQTGQPCDGAVITWSLSGNAIDCGAVYSMTGAGFETRKRQIVGKKKEYVGNEIFNLIFQFK